MSIDESFIVSLSDNKLLAQQDIISEYMRLYNSPAYIQNKYEFYDDFLEIFGLYQVYANKHKLDISFPKLVTDKKINLGLIVSFFDNKSKEIEKDVAQYTHERRFYDKMSYFKIILDNEFFFELNDIEVYEISILLDKIIKIIDNDPDFLDKINNKLYKRAVYLRSNLKTKIRSLDQFWGLVGEGGISIARMGKKAKPIFSSVREILNIIWSVQVRSENLLSNAPTMNVSFLEKEN